MKIERLTVENFRCFKHQEILFSQQFNMLAGDNGTGKTAVLDAIAIGVGAFLRSFTTSPTHPRPFQPRDAHIINYRFDEEITAERQFPVVVTCEGEVDGKACSWQRRLKSSRGRGSEQSKSPLSDIAEALAEKVMEGKPVTLPMVAYYGTGRLWAQKRNESENLLQLTKLFPMTSRLMGYDGALNRTSNDKKLF